MISTMILSVFRREEAFQSLICSIVGIRSASNGTQDPADDNRMMRQVSSPPVTLHPESTLDFWASLVYSSEGVTDRHKELVPPPPLLKFYHDDIPLTMAHKSFLFTCVVGLGPLLIHGVPHAKKMSVLRFVWPPDCTPKLPVFQSRAVDRLAAWHLLHLLDNRSVRLEGPTVLKHLDREDRLQYLHESEHHAAVEQLERSRWLYLHAENEATWLSQQQLQTTILVDMSMLLLWHRTSRTSEQHQIPNLVICLAMIFLGMNGHSENDWRIAYFLIQQTFQSLRCRNLQTYWRHDSFSEAASGVATECAEDIQRGWSLFTKAWKPQSLPLPSGSRFFCKHELLKSGLWPILLNPFKLSGRKWADVEDQSPFKGLKAHSALKEAVFTLDPKMFGSNINTEEAAAPYEDRIAALKMYTTEIFSKMGTPSEGAFLKNGEDPSAVCVSRMVVLARAAGLSRWLLGEHESLLHDVTWASSDPNKTGLRRKLAVNVATDLSPAGNWRHCRRAVDRFLEKLQLEESNSVCSLTRWCPSCHCNTSPPDEKSRLEILRLFVPFCSLMPGDQIPTASLNVRKAIAGNDESVEVPLHTLQTAQKTALSSTNQTPKKKIGSNRRRHRTRLVLAVPSSTEDESEDPECSKPSVDSGPVMRAQPLVTGSRPPLFFGSISISLPRRKPPLESVRCKRLTGCTEGR